MAEIKRNTRQFVLPVCKWEAVVREGDGNAEDVFDRQGSDWIDHVPEWAAYHVVSMGPKEKINTNDILDLQVQDQECLFLNIRKCLTGDLISLRVACEHCREQTGIQLNIDDIKFSGLPPDAEGEKPTFKIMLPRSGWECEFGYINGHQEVAAVEKIKRGITDSINLLFESIIQLGPYRQGVDLKFRHLKELLTMDRAVLRGAFDSKFCEYDTRYKWTCKYCRKPNVTNILSQKGFFVPTV